MKRLTALLLCLLMLFSLAACCVKTVPLQREPREERSDAREEADAGDAPEADAEPEPSPEADPEPVPEPEPEMGPAAETALAFMARMAEGNYAGCLPLCSDAFLRRTDAAGLEELWNSVAEGLGDFVALEPELTITGSYMGHDTAVAFCAFERGGLGGITLYDEDGLVDSLLLNYYTPLALLPDLPEGGAEPPMWEVTGPDGSTLYLFGSLHLAREDLYGLPDAVMEAYEVSDALAVEYDVFAATFDMASLAVTAQHQICTDGTTIRDHLLPDTYAGVCQALESFGLYSPALETLSLPQLNAYLTAPLYTELGFDSACGVDRYLLTLAHYSGKPILSVETHEEQMELLYGSSDLYMDASFRGLLDHYAEEAELLDGIYQAYCDGEEELLTELLYTDSLYEDSLATYTAEQQAAILAEHADRMDRMYDERNYAMADAALECLNSGDTVFFVMGAAHMLGDTGLVTLLREAGCAVDRVRY